MKPAVTVIGAGFWGRNLLRNFHALHALAGICDADPALLANAGKAYANAAKYSRLEDVLHDDPAPAVVIATPAETHARLVRAALVAGKDVFVEKPLCLSVDEGAALVRLARDRERILMVGHLLWYHPAILKLKELVDAGELGAIRYIYSHRLNIGKIRREENILWSFAPHDISVILGLLGCMPEHVQSQGGYYIHRDMADVTVSLLSFPHGIKAHIFVSWLHPFKEQKLVVVGEKRMAVFDDVRDSNKLVLYPHTIEWTGNVPVAHKAEADPVPLDGGEPLRIECAHFLDCIATRSVPRTDGEEGLRVLRILQQCEESLKYERDQTAIPTGAVKK